MKLTQYAEHFGRFWESQGANRGQGKILGWLLVCDPPHQSSKQLQETLQVSAGAVSSNTRLLENLGLIERVTYPGDRSVYYRMADTAWEYIMDNKMRGMSGLRLMADEGLAAIGDAEEGRLDRILKMVELLDFIDEGYRDLVKQWHARKEQS